MSIVRIALTTSLAAALLAACPTDASAQTTCEPPALCATGEAINAAADTLCRRARAAELRLSWVLDDLAAVQAQRDVCHGRLLELIESRAVEPSRAPLWLRIALDIGVGALAATAGTLAAVNAPGEVVVGFAVGAAGALVSRVVLEIVW